MAWIPYFQYVFICVVIIGKLQRSAEGKTLSTQHHMTSKVFHHSALKRKESKRKTTNAQAYKINTTPQEPHFEPPVKKSTTGVIEKEIGGQNNIKTRLSAITKASYLRKMPNSEKRKKDKINKKDARGRLELSDDFLAGSVKQSSAIENALSFRKTSFLEIPRPLSSIEEKTKKTAKGRATKSTIDILSEKTNPEGGMEDVARFRSEPGDKTVEISFDENGGDTSLKNEESLFRRTMPKEKAKGIRLRRYFHDENSFDDAMDNEFSDGEETNSNNYEMQDSGWESPEVKKKIHRVADETLMLKHLLKQDNMEFGTLQEAKDEQNTIKEIEKISKQSSVLPKNLHLPYMSGPSDDMGLDFSKMDISIGKLNTMENSDLNENEDGKENFLKRHSVPATGTGHAWQTRNRDKIPRHQIETPDYQSLADMESEKFEQFPKFTRFPAFYRSPEIRPIELERFHRVGRFPPIAPAILTREDKAPREPIPPREAEPEDEPLPVSEFIQADEPAPIPELPSLREIPPIPEIREPEPKNLNPKDTFGS